MSKRGDFEGLRIFALAFGSLGSRFLFCSLCAGGQCSTADLQQWARSRARDQGWKLRDLLGTVSEDLLVDCCVAGSLETLKWLRDKFGLGQVRCVGHLLLSCLNSGNPDIASWIVQEFGISPSMVQTIPREENDDDTSKLVLAELLCIRSVSGLQWLVQWTGVNKETLLRADVVQTLSRDEHGGGVLRWLVEFFSLSRSEACGPGDKVLAWRLRHCDFETADWLARRFGLNLSDAVRPRARELLWYLICGGKLGMVKRLLEAGCWNKDVLGQHGNDFAEAVFSVACCHGDLELASWLRGQHPITKASQHLEQTTVYIPIGHANPLDDEPTTASAESFDRTVMTQILSCNLFKVVCKKGDLDTAEWLARTFDVTRAELLSSSPWFPAGCRELHVLHLACLSGSLPLVRWLSCRFSLSHSDFVLSSSLAAAVTSGSAPLVSYLLSTFSFTQEDLVPSLSLPPHPDILGLLLQIRH